MSSASTVLVSLPSKVRSKITNDPSSRHGRSTASRRIRDLFAAYIAALGGPADPPTMALVLAAAEAVTIAETARADHIAGKGDLTLVVRAEGTAARALRRIGMNKIVPPPRESFIEKLVAREAAQARTEANATESADVAAGANKRTGDVASQAGEVVA
jgi:hypothetical protein